jgi:hypothetical protein
VAELGVGTVTHSALQLGLGIAALLGGLGVIFSTLGIAMIWLGATKSDDLVPDTVPDSLTGERDPQPV